MVNTILINVLGSIAEEERTKIKVRQKEGILLIAPFKLSILEHTYYIIRAYLFYEVIYDKAHF